jgi:rhomboid family protein
LIPIRDTVRSRTFPIVTVLLIACNSAIFLFELSLGDRLDQFIAVFGLAPGAVVQNFHHYLYIPAIVPFFSAMFLHGGWLHLLGNMLYLWVFGDNVEDAMGHGRFLVFYILCGLGAATGQFYSNPHSMAPMIGASGAIAGVLGAYFLLYPRAKVVTLIPIFILFYFIEIPAVIFLGFWFLMQFLSGSLALSSEAASAGGIAWWAHVGGFASGMLLVFPFRKRNRR